MRGTKTEHVNDFWIFDPPGEPMFIDFVIPKYLNCTLELWTPFWKIIFLCISTFWKSKTSICLTRFGKGGHRKMVKTHLKNLETLGYGTNIYLETRNEISAITLLKLRNCRIVFFGNI